MGHSLLCNLTSRPSYPRSSMRSSSLAVLWTATRQQWRARAPRLPQAFPSRGSTEAVRLRCSQLTHRWVCRPIGFVPHSGPLVLSHGVLFSELSHVLDIGDFQVSDVEGNGGTRGMVRRGWNLVCPNLMYLGHSLRCSTQCPLWLLPLSATLRCCPSTRSSAGE